MALVTKKSLVVLWTCLLFLSISWCKSKVTALPEPMRSDGSIFKSTFEIEEDIAGWEFHGRGVFSIKNGELVLIQSDGDNAMDTPDHKLGRNEEYVVQADFRIPMNAKLRPPFMIIGLLTDGRRGLDWRTNFMLFTDFGYKHTVGVHDPEQTEFEPKLDKGKTYTIAIHMTPEHKAHYFLFAGDQDPGTFLGTVKLTSNRSRKIRIGNVISSASGELVIDNVMLGKPTKPL